MQTTPHFILTVKLGSVEIVRIPSYKSVISTPSQLDLVLGFVV